MIRIARVAAPLFALGLAIPAAGPLFAQEKDEAKSDQSAANSNGGDLHEVQASDFRIEVELKGTLQPENVTRIVVAPEEWKTLKIAELADQGSRVKQGDVILRLETEDLEKQLRQLRFDVRIAELSLQQTERELAALEKTAPLDLALAERSHEQAVETLRFFEETDKELEIEQAKRSVKNAEFSLEYADEELQQLKKMYEADDLTEETEEIILKRAQRSVDNAEFYVELARVRGERTLETEIPRKEETLTDAATRSELELRKTKAVTPLLVEQKRISLEKQRYDLEQNRQKLARLERDRDRLVVEAPQAGVLYYGNWEDGSWKIASSLKSQLKVGGTLPADQVVMTIVQPRPLFVETTVDEGDVAYLEEGTTGTATPTALPAMRIPVRVASVTPFPIEPGKFGTKLNLDLREKTGQLVPGMTATVTLVPYERENAITVPSKAVFFEENRHVVYVETEGHDQPVRRPVEVGHVYGDRTEILSGLKAGEKIRTTEP